MTSTKTYDVIIAGGGLAGISLSIQLARRGYIVGLIEKEQYPFHRVCGEYISLEAWNFLGSLGLDLPSKQVSLISKLEVSSLKGKMLRQSLPLGGFGISRYLMDNELAKISRSAGVEVEENTKVNDMVFHDEVFIVGTSKENYRSKLVCGCFGKRSNIDVKWKRPFVIAAKSRLNNYIGIKYHVQAGFAVDTIALHNFKNGYCGIVKIEQDKYCLCYLTTAKNLQLAKGDIQQMEQTILSQNPYLRRLFASSIKVFESPVVISQISFDRKAQVENHVLMIGDAAGMITPLCGNGMSMALHGSKIASERIILYLDGQISRSEMEQSYEREWRKQFASRLRMGRWVQRLVTSPFMTSVFIMLIRPFPRIMKWMIRRTHGKPF